ncbi:MAG: lamin tail domain-containing protein [Myxococcales bacterium]|nr:lamin tail domain-containing protein [Myxococcales bacterium]
MLAGLAGAIAWAAACSVYTEDLLEPAGTGGAGATGGTTPTGGGGSGALGGGGAAPDCNVVGDCPGTTTTCHTVTCLNHSCGATNAGAGTSCTENGGNVCDGAGSCVECNGNGDCSGTDVCTNHTCGPTPCNNGTKDPNETDVDCGGVCVNGSTGTCAQGLGCVVGADCATPACTDAVCCASACDTPCVSCALAGLEGTCSPIPDGTDPANECAGNDTCNGAGQCRCQDGQPNGSETAPDCGGGVCPACGNGLGCAAPSDCQSGVCTGNLCAVPSCTDSVKNGLETGIDCGGGCPTGCPVGSPCNGGADCDSGVCTASTCAAAVCGDGTRGGAEACDDSNTVSFDGCTSTCAFEAGHLLLSEVQWVVSAAADEWIEVYNPTNAAIDLTNYYLADYNTYFQITTGGAAPINSDFRVRFPAGAQIAAHGFVVVSLHAATGFQTKFGFYPDFDCAAADPNAPDMLGQVGSSVGLTDANEMVVLFYWDGVSPLVEDVDYVTWGNTSTPRMDKTGVTVGGQTYAADTAVALQVPTGGTSTYSTHRCDTAETSETQTGGNGLTSHDETSESGAVAWKTTDSGHLPSPKAAAPAGLCP